MIEILARGRRHAGRDRAHAGHRAGDRGLHRRPTRAAARRAADVLDDGRLGAAVGGAVGRDRPRRAGDVHEHRQHDHLRPAHRRRPAGVRRSRGAVPLRVAHRPRVRHRRAGAGDVAGDARRAVPRDRRRRAPVPLGRPARRASRLASARALRSGAWAGVGGWVRRRRRGGRQPRRAHARRPRPRPRHRPHPPADRRAPFTAAGSPSRCGGSAPASPRPPPPAAIAAAPSPPPGPASSTPSPPTDPQRAEISTSKIVQISTISRT